MFIFIFEPGDHWGYCGGTVVFIAESIDQCRELWGNYNDEKNEVSYPLVRSNEEGRNTKIFYRDGSGGSLPNYYYFVLTHKIELVGEPEPRLLVNNWNWA